jgi:hypothetical protein
LATNAAENRGYPVCKPSLRGKFIAPRDKSLIADRWSLIAGRQSLIAGRKSLIAGR